jgi:hypothetical protein
VTSRVPAMRLSSISAACRLLQLVGAAFGVASPQGHGDDGHVIDAERLDDRFADAEFG